MVPKYAYIQVLDIMVMQRGRKGEDERKKKKKKEDKKKHLRGTRTTLSKTKTFYIYYAI